MGRTVLNPDMLAVTDLPGVSVELDTDLLTTDRRFATAPGPRYRIELVGSLG